MECKFCILIVILIVVFFCFSFKMMDLFILLFSKVLYFKNWVNILLLVFISIFFGFSCLCVGFFGIIDFIISILVLEGGEVFWIICFVFFFKLSWWILLNFLWEKVNWKVLWGIVVGVYFLRDLFFCVCNRWRVCIICFRGRKKVEVEVDLFFVLSVIVWLWMLIIGELLELFLVFEVVCI